MRLAPGTERAGSTCWHGCQDPAIPCTEAADAWSDLGYHACSLVAEYDGQRFGDTAIAHVQVAVADSSGFHTYQYFSLAGRGPRDFFYCGWLFGLLQDHTFLFHIQIPFLF